MKPPKFEEIWDPSTLEVGTEILYWAREGRFSVGTIQRGAVIRKTPKGVTIREHSNGSEFAVTSRTRKFCIGVYTQEWGNFTTYRKRTSRLLASMNPIWQEMSSSWGCIPDISDDLLTALEKVLEIYEKQGSKIEGGAQ